MIDKIEKFRNKILKSNIVIILFFLCLVFISLNAINLTHSKNSDDIFYKEAFRDIASLTDFIKSFANGWGGRIIPSVFSTILLNIDLIIYKIITSVVVVILMYSIYRLVIIKNVIIEDNKKTKLILFITMALFFLINEAVIKQGVIWVTGASNYLWQCLAMMIALIPYVKIIKKVEIKKWEYTIYFAANIYASNSEQAGIILLAFGIIAIVMSIITKNKFKKSILIYYIISASLVIITLIAPGNGVRYQKEILRWYPSFETLSLSDKIFQGLSYMLDHLINKSPIILFILTIFIVFKTFKEYKENNNKQKLIIACIPLIYMTTKIVPINVLFSKVITTFDVEVLLNRFLYNFPLYSTETIYNPMLYISVIIGTFVVIILAMLIYMNFSDKENKNIYTLLYLAGVGSSMCLSFSPTIFASSQRIFMIHDILLITIVIGILSEYLISEKINKKMISVFLIIIFMTIINALNYYLNVDSIF